MIEVVDIRPTAPARHPLGKERRGERETRRRGDTGSGSQGQESGVGWSRVRVEMASWPVADACGRERGSAQRLVIDGVTAWRGGHLAKRGSEGGMAKRIENCPPRWRSLPTLPSFARRWQSTHRLKSLAEWDLRHGQSDFATLPQALK